MTKKMSRSKGGRPAIYGERMSRCLSILVPDHVYEKVRRNGGAAWIRKLIERSKT